MDDDLMLWRTLALVFLFFLSLTIIFSAARGHVYEQKETIVLLSSTVETQTKFMDLHLDAIDSLEPSCRDKAIKFIEDSPVWGEVLLPEKSKTAPKSH